MYQRVYCYVIFYNWQGNTAVEKCRISQSEDDVLTCCAWSPDSRFIYTGGQQGQFYKYVSEHRTALITVLVLYTHYNKYSVYMVWDWLRNMCYNN